MSTPAERNRALIWAGGLLIELARDERLPLDVRRRAATIARHFPTLESIAGPTPSDSAGESTADPTQTRFDHGWLEGLQYGPLKESTRLAWPVERECEGDPAPYRSAECPE